ncbi:MAG: 16S rRNA (cytosine(1402)-N(4))-methyltransferase RsmH [Candidatus Gracilibacteria bacterium]|jgi:16S rRNA (cytosine1402-N4)-methyltransferase
MEHKSVLASEVLEVLKLKKGDTVIDATLGLGGHGLEILKQIGKSGKLIGFDADERNLTEAKKRLKDYKKQIVYINDNFRYLKTRVIGKKVDKVLFDLGIASPHVDEPDRGFSFLKDGPLDMRFDSKQPLNAEVVVNTYPELELIRIFSEYGEERLSKTIAKRICEERKTHKISTTTELAELIKRAYPYKIISKLKHHPATQVFQALRIEVNDELNALRDGLRGAIEVLKVGGILAVISYHSLEDRIVKNFFRDLERPPAQGEELIYSVSGDPFIKIITKKPITPSQKEIEENPRSRSAKLRVAKKLKAVT